MGGGGDVGPKLLKTEAAPPLHFPPPHSFKARVDCSCSRRSAGPFILLVGLFVPQAFFRGTVALQAALFTGEGVTSTEK